MTSFEQNLPEDILNFLAVVVACLRKERSNYHLTLGECIDFLTDANSKIPVVTDFGEAPASIEQFDQYNCDLVFTDTKTIIYSAKFLSTLQTIVNKSFVNSRNHSQVMDRETPLWFYDKQRHAYVITHIYDDGDNIILATKLLSNTDSMAGMTLNDYEEITQTAI